MAQVLLEGVVSFQAHRVRLDRSHSCGYPSELLLFLLYYFMVPYLPLLWMKERERERKTSSNRESAYLFQTASHTHAHVHTHTLLNTTLFHPAVFCLLQQADLTQSSNLLFYEPPRSAAVEIFGVALNKDRPPPQKKTTTTKLRRFKSFSDTLNMVATFYRFFIWYLETV